MVISTCKPNCPQTTATSRKTEFLNHHGVIYNKKLSFPLKMDITGFAIARHVFEFKYRVYLVSLRMQLHWSMRCDHKKKSWQHEFPIPCNKNCKRYTIYIVNHLISLSVFVINSFANIILKKTK